MQGSNSIVVPSVDWHFDYQREEVTTYSRITLTRDISIFFICKYYDCRWRTVSWHTIRVYVEWPSNQK